MTTLSDTTFATIPSFPAYQVSDDGQVRRILKTGAYRSIKPWQSDKHFAVTLTDAFGNRSVFYIHRLVQQVHGPAQPADMPLVCHLDDDPSNNVLQNLVWGNKQTNAQMAVKNGKLCPAHLRNYLTHEKALKARELHRAGMSLTKIAAVLDSNRWSISNAVHDRTLRFREVQGNA